VGLLNMVSDWTKGLRGGRPTKRPQGFSWFRKSRFELLEPRNLMAADAHIAVGAVYYDPASPDSSLPNVFTITFNGGEAGTELKHLVIDTTESDGHQDSDPQSPQTFFAIGPGGIATFGWHPLQIVSHDGFQVTNMSVANDGKQLVLDFSGFKAGDTLTFTIKVDEKQRLDWNAVAEGGEFEGSHLITQFQTSDGSTLQGDAVFLDNFSDPMQTYGLPLPNDAYQPPAAFPSPVLTAGAFTTFSTLSGKVYNDQNVNNALDAGEPGIANVQLSLWQWDAASSAYVSTGRTTMTDAQGNYAFDVGPGKYRVVETQPTGYYSVGAKAGTVGGTVDGVVTTSDIISDVTVQPGDESVQNNFAEALPNSISGHVWVSTAQDWENDPAHVPIANVVIKLFDAQGNLLTSTTTDQNGGYSFTNLAPGTYHVQEIQPAGYFEGDDHVGTVGGIATTVDDITSITLLSATDGTKYDFREIPPGSLEGHVRVDVVPGSDCQTDPNDPGLAGVTINLLDAQGNVLQTAQTDANGEYVFAHLPPATYEIQMVLPQGYFADDDHVGTAGGVLASLQLISSISLPGGINGADYDFCVVQPASIEGYVHNDVNGDCDVNPNAPPVAGVTIELLDASNNILATTTTDVHGHYIFSQLPPGTYSVLEVVPAGYLADDAHVGSAGGTLLGNVEVVGASLGSGVAGVDYNFCLTQPAIISGYVFQEGPTITLSPLDATPTTLAQLQAQGFVFTGIRSPGDAPVPGVTLVLADANGQVMYDSNGNPIETVTDGNGYYQFTGLVPGMYTILEFSPGGFIDGLNAVGSTGGVSINPNGLHSVPGMPTFLTPDAIFAIPVMAGQNSVENNFSVVRVQPSVFFFPQAAPPAPLVVAAPEIPPPAIPQPLPPIVPLAFLPTYFYGGSVDGATWHLSVINSGRPRGDRVVEGPTTQLTASRMETDPWPASGMHESGWILQSRPGELADPRKLFFGVRAGIPVTGDFNGDGVYEVGVFSQGYWFIDLNGNGKWDEGDLWAKLGHDGDQPVTGDWDGDGKTDIGIFGRAWPNDPRALKTEPGLPDEKNLAQGEFKNVPPKADHATHGLRTMRLTSGGKLRSDLIDHVFAYGVAGDMPVTGDWNGDGIHTIGVFRNGLWNLDVDGNGKWDDACDNKVQLGQRGDRPVVGDFNGDGIDELGVYRNGNWFIDTNHNNKFDDQDESMQMGGPGDLPVVGDWDGDGRDEIGVYQDGATLQK
jgi:serine-aspartate repeat-containing protein C/D/E